MKFVHRVLFLSLLSATSMAQAGRPLATDDASTADAQTCQVETWSERAGADHSFVLAPACGLLPGVELDADYTWPNPHDAVRAQGGLALKWVPQGWKLGTPLGEMNFGLKLGGAWTQAASGGWQRSQTDVLGLATLKASESWALHTSLGVAKHSGHRATLLNVALVWTPRDAVLLFAEAQGNTRRDVFGGTVATLGARWWMVKDMLGLDLSASRESDASGPTRWSLGLGWYGIGL
jgi:hypothetical protein